MGPEIQQGLIDDHKSQTDRMTSVFLLSDVDVSLIYPNQNVIAPRRWIASIPLIEPLNNKGPHQTAMEPIGMQSQAEVEQREKSRFVIKIDRLF